MKTNREYLVKRLKNRIRLNRKTFILYSVLRLLVILTAIRCFFTGNYESLALCLLSLILFLMPALAEEKLSIEIPPLFEAIIYLFIYAAEILGEINHYYVLIPGWDTMLHTLNGFLCAAVGFSMVYLLNRQSSRLNLSPFYLALTAFCFSMTIGVLWEFFEFTMDQLFQLDMQKDFIVKTFGSVTLDPANSGKPILVSDIVKTMIYTASGKTYTISGGYLDIGIIDTMKDLLVNFAGALGFDIFGYLAVRFLPGRKMGDGFLIRKMSDQEAKELSHEVDEEESFTTKEKLLADEKAAKMELEELKSRVTEKKNVLDKIHLRLLEENKKS